MLFFPGLQTYFEWVHEESNATERMIIAIIVFEFFMVVVFES